MRHKILNTFKTISVVLACFLLPSFGLASEQESDKPKEPNHTSTRYEVNQTFDGVSFHKDNNIWTYNAQFAETFGMPQSGVDTDLIGIEAAAYRIETYDYKLCGMGGKAEQCIDVNRCMLDVYVDEKKHPLPWRYPEQKADWQWRYNSSKWLNTAVEGARLLLQATPEFIPIVGFNRRGTLRPFIDLTTAQEVAYFSRSTAIDRYSLERPVEIHGFKRKVIAGLTLINFHLGCSPLARDDRPIRFRLESRKETDSPTIKRFHEFILPSRFTQQIKERIEKHDEMLKGEFQKALGASFLQKSTK